MLLKMLRKNTNSIDPNNTLIKKLFSGKNYGKYKLVEKHKIYGLKNLWKNVPRNTIDKYTQQFFKSPWCVRKYTLGKMKKDCKP